MASSLVPQAMPTLTYPGPHRHRLCPGRMVQGWRQPSGPSWCASCWRAHRGPLGSWEGKSEQPPQHVLGTEDPIPRKRMCHPPPPTSQPMSEGTRDAGDGPSAAHSLHGGPQWVLTGSSAGWGQLLGAAWGAGALAALRWGAEVIAEVWRRCQ